MYNYTCIQGEKYSGGRDFDSMKEYVEKMKKKRDPNTLETEGKVPEVSLLLQPVSCEQIRLTSEDFSMTVKIKNIDMK